MSDGVNLIDASYGLPDGAVGFIKGSLVHRTDWLPGEVKTLDKAFPGLPGYFRFGVDTVYVFPDGVMGFVKGNVVHQTDWPAGTSRTLVELLPNLPADFGAGVDAVYAYPNRVLGLIRGGVVHNMDWPVSTVKTLGEMFPTIPAEFRNGIDSAHLLSSGVHGFVKGGLAHRTDWPAGATRPLAEVFPTLPYGWAHGGPVEVVVESPGTNPNFSAGVIVNGVPVTFARSPEYGIKVVVIDQADGRVLGARLFDTHDRPADAEAFAALVEGLPTGRLVAVAATRLTSLAGQERAVRACESLGSALIRNLSNGGSWAMLGRRGLSRGLATEQLSGSDAVTVRASIPLEGSDGPGPIRLTAVSARREDPGSGPRLEIQGDVLAAGDYQLTMVVVDGRTGVVTDRFGYDLVSGNGQADRFAADVEAVPGGQVVALVVAGDCPAPAFTDRAHAACSSLGGLLSRQVRAGDRWSLVGVKGEPPGSAAEAWSATGVASGRRWHVPARPTSATGFSVSLRSAGHSSGVRSSILLGGLPLSYGESRTFEPGEGLNLAVIDEATGEQLGAYTFDTAHHDEQVDDFIRVIEGLPVGRLVAIAAEPPAEQFLTERARRACESVGSGLIRNLRPGDGWALIGRKGSAPGSVPEILDQEATGLGLQTTIALDEPGLARSFVVLQANSMGALGGVSGQFSSIRTTLNSRTVRLPEPRPGGLWAAVIDEATGEAIEARVFDTAADAAASQEYAQWVAELPAERVVAVVVDGDARRNLSDQAILACESLGAGLVRDLVEGGSWALVGKKGATPATVAEAVSGRGLASCVYWLFPDDRYPGHGFNVSISSNLPRTHGDASRIMSRGELVPITDGYGPGLNVAVLDETDGRPVTTARYDTSRDVTAADRFAALVEGLPAGQYVVITVLGDATGALNERAIRACELLGSGQIRNLTSDGAWCMVGIKGTSPGSALEHLMVAGPVALSIWVPFPSRTRNPLLLAALLIGTAVLAITTLMVYHAIPSATPAPLPAPKPPTRPRYDQLTWLVAHNAMAARDDGWSTVDRQQNMGVPRLLAYGIRGLALDIHPFTPPYDIPVPGLYLCHGSCQQTLNIHAGVQLRTLTNVFTDIAAFLNDPANRDEIVTVFFESQDGWNPTAAQNQMLVDALDRSGALPLTFWPDTAATPPGANVWNPDVNPTPGVYGWPTLDDMRRHNTRLVLFVDRLAGDPNTIRHPYPFVWRYVRETNFSDQDSVPWSSPIQERGPSSRRDPNRTLHLLNHFPWLPLAANYANINSYNRLLARVKEYAATFNAVPTFIGIDFVEVGDGQRLVNDLNTKVWTDPNPVAALQRLTPDHDHDDHI